MLQGTCFSDIFERYKIRNFCSKNIYFIVLFWSFFLIYKTIILKQLIIMILYIYNDITYFKAIASFLTPHTKKLLVNALVMPYFHYCSPAWSNAAPFRLSKINKKVVDASVFLGREDNYILHL